ncbi:MAG: serine/threonine-protein kinase [Vicinamibacterales bacterium]
MSTLSPARWAEIERRFDDLSALEPDARARALDRLDDTDSDLAALLRRMLSGASDASNRIAGAVGRAAADMTHGSEWLGRRFGPYRAIREIGRGGMGIVFEAVRADDEYRKRVALKIAPGWRAYPGLVERFRAERQILAELETETIARFLDGGTEGGVPYFVMEFVDGEPITDFCERRALSLTARLQLFQRVCAGVAFAHERLVVHRDLKPANILVTNDGVPKLVDFGVAKLLDDVGDTSATQTSFPAWTPDYVSPEQLRGRSVSQRTDVYALGLVLYELLCGERGQNGDTSSLLALDRSVCEHEAVAPSERARRRNAMALARELTGDLDTIVLKAIRKEPDERYSSVGAFADDLQRYLDDRPILARDVGPTERTIKFVRRHRAAASFVAVLVGTAAAGVISTIRQAKRAERRFQQVRSLAHTFVFDVHDSIADLPGSTEARKRIVSTALSYLESLRDDAEDDPELAKELAEAYIKVASVQGLPVRTNLGDTAGAIESYVNALRILEPLPRTDIESELLRGRGLLEMATVMRARGDRDGSTRSYDMAEQIARRLCARMPDSIKAVELRGSIASDRARAAVEQRDYASAERFAREAMDAAQRLVARQPDERMHQDGLASALNALGMAQLGTARLEQAAEHFGESVRLRRLLVAAEPDNPERRRSLAISCGHLADVLGFRIGENLGDVDGAIAALSEAAELAEWARARDVKDRRALYDLANARVRLGALHLETTPPDPEAALRELRSALASADELLAQDPHVAAYRGVQISVLRRLGDALYVEGRADEAVDVLMRAIDHGLALTDSSNGLIVRGIVALARSRLVLIHASAGRDDDAMKHARIAATELEYPGMGAAILADAHAQLGEALAMVASHTGVGWIASSSDSSPITDVPIASGTPLDGRHGMALARSREHIDIATRLWREARVSPALEVKRTAALDRLARVSASCS